MLSLNQVMETEFKSDAAQARAESLGTPGDSARTPESDDRYQSPPTGSPHERAQQYSPVAILAISAIVGLYFGSQILFIQLRHFGSHEPFWKPLVLNVLGYLIWGALAIVLLNWLDRNTFDVRRPWRSMALHATVGLAVSLLHLVLAHFLVFQWFRPSWYRPESSLRELELSFVGNMHANLLTYGVIVGTHFAL